MKRLMLSLGLCALLSSCNVLRGGSPPGNGVQQCPAPTSLPPLQPFKADKPLPTEGTTHLVAGLCLSEPMSVMVYGVDARGCSITFRLSASGPGEAQALLTQSHRSGLPLTVFTSPVSPASGSTGDSTFPLNPCDLTKSSQQTGDVPPGPGRPVQGMPPQQRGFARIALDAARALDSAVK